MALWELNRNLERIVSIKAKKVKPSLPVKRLFTEAQRIPKTQNIYAPIGLLDLVDLWSLGLFRKLIPGSFFLVKFSVHFLA